MAGDQKEREGEGKAELVGFAEHTRPCSRVKVVRRKNVDLECETSSEIRFGKLAVLDGNSPVKDWPLRTDWALGTADSVL